MALSLLVHGLVTGPALLSNEASCVGRDVELERISALYEQAVGQGRGHVVLVTGPAGVGKGALAGLAVRRFRTAGVPVFEGRARPGAPPFQAVAELAEGLLEHLGRAPSAGVDLAHYGEMCGMLRGRAPARPQAAHRLALFDGVRQLVLAATGGGPAVVVLHDLHLADEATRALVDFLFRTLAPPTALRAQGFRGLVVATSRGDRGVPADTSATRLDLGGLDKDGVRAFLVQNPLVERLLRASGGIPRRLEELLARPAALPETLAAERLASLSPAAARLAAIVALYGRPAGSRLLAKLAPREVLIELGECPAVARQIVGGELTLGLLHAEDREQALALVDADTRRRLHRELGAALAVVGDGDLAEIASHRLAGGEGEVAVDAALAAGAELERAFASERAVALYEAALAATQVPSRADELVTRLAIVAEKLGDYDAALRHARDAVARDPKDGARHARLGHLHLLRGELPAAFEHLARAQSVASAAGDRGVCARALADGAEAYVQAGAYERALAEGHAALAVAEGPEHTAVRIAARNSVGKVHLMQGALDAAEAEFAKNLADAEHGAHGPEAARALVNLGIVAIRRGDTQAALLRYRAGLDAADSCGDLRHRAFCLQNLGVLAQWRRDYREALPYYQEAIATFMRLGHRPNVAWVALDLGDLYLGLGAVAQAEAMADLGAQLAPDASPTLLAILANLRGRAALERGALAEARTHLATALGHARAAQSPDEIGLALLAQARLELADDDADEAIRLCEDVPAPRPPRIRVQTGLIMAEAELERDDPEAARAKLAELDADLGELGDAEAELRALLLAARAATDLGETRQARRLRDRARAVDVDLRARVPADYVQGYGREAMRNDLAGGRDAAPLRAVRPVLAAGTPPRVWHGIVGAHPRLLQAISLVQRVAPSDSLVLIRGESGTGKELVAEAIHRESRRANRPFVKVNCAALVDTLLLSELFGHERGAFTGALARKKGRFELADGGTLFLDEIGDVSPQTQVALLRVLQTREFERVGGTESLSVDVRILCATNRDLETMVQRGQFREDLYYRLQGLEVPMPALRERPSDIPMLARHFLARVAHEQAALPRRLTRAAEERLAAAPWPGNVRELENVMRSISLFCDGDVIDAADLADYLPVGPAQGLSGDRRRGDRFGGGADMTSPADSGLTDIYERAQSLGLSLKELKREIERQCITRALAEASGNITRAAELLGMKRPRLSQLLKEHGIVPRPHLTEVA
jgi:DNA-binding NtrC family response regulator